MVRWIARQYLASFRGLSPQVWLVAVTILINRSGTMVLPFFALYATSELGLSVTASGRLLAIYGVGAVAGNWLGGWFTGKFGPFVVQFGSLTLAAVGFLLLSTAHETITVGACLFLLSLVGEAYRPASATATTLLAPPNLHTRAFALNRLAVNLGMSIGPVLGGFLAEVGFNYLFYADAATCFLAALFVAATLGLRPPEELDHAEPNRLGNVGSPWRDGQFLAVMALLFLAGMVFFQLMGTYVLYLEEHFHFTKPMIGGMLAINTVLIVLVEMPVILHTERFSRLRMLACGCALFGLGFGLLPLGRGFAFAAALMVVLTAGEILESAPSLAYVSGRGTRANRAAYMGFYSMTMSAAFVLAPLVGMSIYAIHPDWLWYACLVICTVVAGGLCFVGTRTEQATGSGAAPVTLAEIQSGDLGPSAQEVALEMGANVAD